jgi:hypothetical protein
VAVFGGADPLPRPRDLVRTLRHADVSIVIDLSHTPHQEKIEYLRSVLPALAMLRRHTGLPHHIVVDEAHYFLHDSDVRDLLDLDLSGYILVTYRASSLHRDLLAASQAVIVTRESDPHEVSALFALCRSCESHSTENELGRVLGSLVIGEAAALPVTEEAEGDVRRIRLAPRLTPHVRHLSKYIDIPVQEGRAFVFWQDGSPTGRRARTLREFVAVLEQFPAAAFDGHLRRSDFSSWIANVFGDYPLASAVSKVEDDYRKGGISDVATSVLEAIRSRYEFIEPATGPSI